MDDRLSVGSVFTGVGGFDVAFERAGARVVWQVENDANCAKVLAQRWPEVPHYGDVKEVTREKLFSDLGDRAAIDVLVGGFPCTDLSVAGRRAGLAGERSGLFFQFMRLAVELAPRWLLIENVPGLLSSCGCPGCRPSDEEVEDEEITGGRTRPDHRGRDMATVLGTLAQCGFGWAYRCLDAQYFGVPQRRRRIFIVGCAGGRVDRAAQVLLEPESGSGDPAPSREKGARTAGSLTGGSGARGWSGDRGDGSQELVAAIRSSYQYGADDNQAQARHLIPVDLRNGTLGDEVAGTLQAHHESYSVNAIPHLIPGEDAAEVVAFSETGKGWWTGPNEQAATLSARDYKSPRELVSQEETVVAFSAKDYGADATEDMSPTLRAMGHDQSWENGGGQVAVAFSVYPESGQGSDLVARETDVAPALSAEGLAKANDRKMLVTYAIQDVRDLEKDQNGLGVGDEVAYTLDATGGQGVAYPLAVRGREDGAELEVGEAETYNALRAGDGGSSRQALVAIAENQRGEVLETDYAHQMTGGGGKPGQGYPAVRDGLQVRRLLPLECERLQAFPDDWTAAGPDSARYKQMGNAVTVNVVTWIARRLVAVDATP